ncbi:hypothetical protein Tco_1474423 [Tanacetum coccineum]
MPALHCGVRAFNIVVSSWPDTHSSSVYDNNVNYAGCFAESPGRRYVNGEFAYFDCIDIDEFSVHELNDMVKEIGFSGKNIMYYSFLKLDMSLDNGLYALGNDEDVRRMTEYIRLGVSPINASPVSKIKPRRPVSRIYAKKLLLGWKQNDANVIGESNSRLEDVEDFDPFFGLDIEHVHATTARNECVGNGKGVALDDDQIHVEADGNSDGDTNESSEHDEFIDTYNQLVDVEVDMDHFDTGNAKIMGNDGTPKLNANEVFDIGIDVIDTEEFESAFDEDGIERIRKFPNSAIVKDLVHRHSIETRRELYLKKNDKVRVRAACKGTIPVFTTSYDIGPSKVVESSQTQRGESSQPTKWTKGKIANSKGVESPLNKSKKVGGKPTLRKVAANECPCVLQVSKLQDSETWQVKTFDDTYKCLQSRKIKYCTTDFLSEDIIDQIETNPEIPVKEIQEQLQRKFQLEVSRMKAFRAKPKAVDNVRVESEADHMKPTRVFKRIYVYLGAAKEGFKACMRHFLGFDGTFMKGPFPGQLLTAVGVDPNNGIYPLAYGIGIILAIAKLFPAAEHGFCLRNIHENMKLKWRGAAYKELLWKAATGLTVPYFEKVMDELKAFNKECYDWLAKIPPNH